MKVFISSLIGGFGAFRDAAATGIRALGYDPVRAEDFGASPTSPQQACLAGVRDADAVILLLGADYGARQTSGLSATHEEYREARDTKPVLVFIQDGVDPDPDQAAFIKEVRGWEHGHFNESFATADELRDRVIRGLHDYTLVTEVPPSTRTRSSNGHSRRSPVTTRPARPDSSSRSQAAHGGPCSVPRSSKILDFASSCSRKRSPGLTQCSITRAAPTSPCAATRSNSSRTTGPHE